MFPIDLVNKIFENIAEMNNQSWIVRYEIKQNELHETRILNKYKHQNLEKLISDNTIAEETNIQIDGSVSIKMGYLVKMKVKLNEYGEEFREGIDYDDESIEHDIMLLKITDESNNGYIYLQYGGRSLLDWNIYNVSNDYTTGIQEMIDDGDMKICSLTYNRSSYQWCSESRRIEYIVHVF